MVEIFKTTVEEVSKANIIVGKLLQKFPTYRINFDLNDHDRILRVESYSDSIDIESIVGIAKQYSLEISLISE